MMSAVALEVSSAIADLDPTGISPKILGLISRINEQYGQMKDNQEVCLGLKTEVNLISAIVEKLCATKQIDPCEKTLIEVEICLTQCLTLIESIGARKDTRGKIKAFLSAKGDQESITKLTIQLTTLTDILNLALTARTANTVEQMSELIERIAKKESEILPEIKERKVKIDKDIHELTAHIQSINVTNNTANAVGHGGSARVNVNVNMPQLSSFFSHRNSLDFQRRLFEMKEKSENEQDTFVLKELKQLFVKESRLEKSEPTSNLEIYNKVLGRNCKAFLAHNGQLHELFIGDESVPAKDVLKKITEIINSLTASPTVGLGSLSPKSPASVDKRRESGIREFSKKDETENMLDALKEWFLSRICGSMEAQPARQADDIKLFSSILGF